MKKTAFILFFLPVFAFSQQLSLMTQAANDSLAKKNVSTVLHFAKKNFRESSFSSYYVSETALNVSELNRNTYNFNTLNRGLFVGEHIENFMPAFPNRATVEHVPAARQLLQIQILDK